MEPRSAIGAFDTDADRYVLRLGCQGVFGMRNLLKDVLGVPVEKVHVLTGSVGGSFGMKASCYPEYFCLLHAAKQLGRPVKWTDERSESFLSDSHGRDHDMTAELALDQDGLFLALRITGYGNLGAVLSNATTIPPTLNTVKNIIGVYRTPLIEVATRCVFTNTTPVGAYRGAGRPEGNYYMERLVETAARDMGIDCVELRRRNHIGPQQMPYAAPSGMVYDSGDFPAILDEALVAADWDGFAARHAESARRGKIRGRGIGHYLEVTADAGNEMGGIRFEPDGDVTIITARSTMARAMPPPSPRCCRTSSACRSSGSGCCRAIPMRCWPAAAPAAPARSCRAAARSSRRATSSSRRAARSPPI